MSNEIKTVKDFQEALKQGSYAWPGGYPLFFFTSDGGCLHPKCAEENQSEIESAIEDNETRSGWHVECMDINWEDENLSCDHCNELIECAYPSD